MSGPRTKRQFAGAASDPSQRSITSFFTKTSSSTLSANSNNSASSRPAALNGPHLPAQVQTDLLTVGMRVRKAIPEGYKTHDTYGSFQLWTDNNNTSIPSSHKTSNTSVTSAMRELEPFCGINKVGGLAFQPSFNPSSSPNDDDEDTMPGLTSSQDSIASTITSTPPPPSRRLTTTITATPVTTPTMPTTPRTATMLPTRPRKRVLLTDEDEEARDAHSTPFQHAGPFRHMNRDEDKSWLEDEISPRSMAPPAGLWENARVLAVPRRGPRQLQMQQQLNALGVGGKGAVVGVGVEEEMAGQENVVVVVQDGNDFEEAAFLDYGLGGEMEIE